MPEVAPLLIIAFGAGYLLRVVLGWCFPSVGAQRIAALGADRAPTSTDLLAGQVSGLAVEIGALASAVDRQTEAMERSMKLALEGVPL